MANTFVWCVCVQHKYQPHPCIELIQIPFMNIEQLISFTQIDCVKTSHIFLFQFFVRNWSGQKLSELNKEQINVLFILLVSGLYCETVCWCNCNWIKIHL